MVDGARKGGEAIDRIDDKAARIDSRFKKLQKRTVSLGDVFSSLSVGLVANQFKSLLDAATVVDTKLKLVTNSTEELNAVYDELLRISNLTGSSLSDNARVFNRVSNATKSLGLSYKETIDFTEDLNKLLTISGATAAETSSVMIQLSQGLAAGALQGDEFKSVAEAMPRLLDLVTEELNRTSGGAKITKAELKKLASEGVITADVLVNAFKNSSDKINEDFKNVGPTIGSAFTAIKNNLQDFVRDVNTATGVSATLGRALNFVAENVDLLAGAITGLTAIMAGQLIVNMLRMSAVFFATPIGVVVAGFVALTAAVGAFSRKTIEVGGVSATSFQLIEAAIMTVGQAFDSVVQKYNGLKNALLDNKAFMAVFNFIKKEIGVLFTFIQGVAGGIRTVINAILTSWRVSFLAMTDGFTILFKGAKVVWKNIKELFFVGVESLTNFLLGKFADLVDKISGVFGKSGLGDVIKENLSVDLGGDISGVFDDVASDIDNFKSNLKDAFEADNVSALTDTLKGAVNDGLQLFNDNLEKVTKSSKKQKDKLDVLSNSWSDTGDSIGATDDALKGTTLTFDDIVRSLEQEIDVLRETGIAADQLSEKYRVMDALNRNLTEGEEAKLNALLATRDGLEKVRDATEDLTGSMTSLVDKLMILESLEIDPEKDQFGFKALQKSISETRIEMVRLSTEAGLGGFKEGFMLSLSDMTEGLRNWRVEAGQITGDFVSSFSSGFGDAIGDALWQTDSLKESLKSVARDAISQVVSSIVQIGVKMAANAVLGNLLAAKTTAASAVSAGLVASAWAAPAALVSLASFGANSVPASSGILSTMALSQSLSAFRDGGIVRGRGTSRSDSILARLSDGEFVVNSKATSNNRGLLEAMNDGRSITSGGGGTVVMNITTPDADSFQRSSNQIAVRQTALQERIVRRSKK